MDVIGVIPARYGSTRLPAKALADILGKPMIQHIYERAKEASVLDEVIVATDDIRIKDAVDKFGGKVILTSKEHSSGTERLTEVVFDLDVKIIVNIQGDEPLIEPSMINDVAYALLENENLVMATLKHPITNTEDYLNPNVVKVVTTKDNFALYFSRSPIPNISRKNSACPNYFYKHLGIYAYTKDFLLTFKGLKISKLEQAESLEQLRALEHGYPIKVIETKHNTVGVDTEEDLQRVIEILK
ncbi:MAG: 3-deoxy-manno-octulosonate cytidylyltransferase, partial [Candidatus Omnitrophica bacterium]|nr:3-deoxy-manno-octulosonate cytidylyltransferase [Candidatus Omnitrophota bacterium]